MRVTVITVCLNSAKTIADTLRSIYHQTYAEIEHIVIDGGSTDDTIKIIREFANSNTVFVSEPDQGIYDAMNKGLNLATGEIVGFLNSDDFYADTRVLEMVVDEFKSDVIDACYGDIIFTSRNNPKKIKRYWRPGEFDKKKFAYGWMPPHPTLFVKSSIYRDVGFFNLKYKIQSDFDMAIRLFLLRTLKISYIPEILVIMRLGGASNSSLLNILKGNVEAANAVTDNNLFFGPWFIILKIFNKLPQYFRRPH